MQEGWEESLQIKVNEKWGYFSNTFEFQADTRLTERIKTFLPLIHQFIQSEFGTDIDTKRSFALAAHMTSIAIIRSGHHSKEQVELAFYKLTSRAPRIFTLKNIKKFVPYVLGAFGIFIFVIIFFGPKAASATGAGLILAAFSAYQRRQK